MCITMSHKYVYVLAHYDLFCCFLACKHKFPQCALDYFGFAVDWTLVTNWFARISFVLFKCSPVNKSGLCKGAGLIIRLIFKGN